MIKTHKFLVYITLGDNTPLYIGEVVDRHTLGHQRPHRSMGHYNNLHDRTRTVARVKAEDLKV